MAIRGRASVVATGPSAWPARAGVARDRAAIAERSVLFIGNFLFQRGPGWPSRWPRLWVSRLMLPSLKIADGLCAAGDGRQNAGQTVDCDTVVTISGHARSGHAAIPPAFFQGPPNATAQGPQAIGGTSRGGRRFAWREGHNRSAGRVDACTTFDRQPGLCRRASADAGISCSTIATRFQGTRGAGSRTKLAVRRGIYEAVGGVFSPA